MGMLKFEVPHGLSKDEAITRVKKLVDHWGGKYGVQSTWSGDGAKLSGKVMGISLDATLVVTDKTVGGEASDPGMLLRGRARKYLEEKFGLALDPSRSVEDLSRQV